ncbi:MAG: hypothetical protein V1926_01225 [Candidatus Peregrinibacteria bacterium]
MSTTRTVSIRHFRENLTKFLREAREKNVHFVIMRHAVPVARVEAVAPHDSLESLIADISQARKEVKMGNVYSAKEVRALLGL